jgi:cell division septum initiation protein DivIVA
MTARKKSDKLDESLKKAASSIGKALARSQIKLAKTKRQAVKKAEKMVDKVTHSAEQALDLTVKKIHQAEDRISGTEKVTASRFSCRGKKSVTDSIGLLANEIKAYLEEHEEIGLSKLVSVMKNLRNSEAMTFGAIGWLARDGKIAISGDGKKISIR